MENICSSWLHGKHSPEIEINTKLPYVSIYDYFAQGEDADNVIGEIKYIWIKEDITILQAIEKWASYYL
jgi:hypothetical protein